ncbi:MAG: hypothetical protein KC613_27920, partial [Myxococcales bacterium]|nr:hypothetical protein [Myxococcales bacterium]
ERGVLGIHDAMAALGVARGKAMGGITGSIARWAPEYGVTVPFEAVRGPDGRRAWRWIGQDRAPAPPVPVRRRRRRGRGAPSTGPADSAPAPEPSEPVQAAPPPGNALAEVLEALPPESARFLQMLVTRGRLTQSDALRHLGLARAQGLARVLDPLEAALADHGLSDRLHRTVDERGRQGWRWGHEESHPPAPSTPEHPDRGLAGVRVRKAPGH